MEPSDVQPFCNWLGEQPIVTDETPMRSMLTGSYQPLSDDALHRAADQANQGYGAARVAEIMRLQTENARLHQAHEQYVNAQRALTKNACDWRDAEIAKLRAAYAELEARFAALHALHAANPVGLVDAATGFPTNALRHSV